MAFLAAKAFDLRHRQAYGAALGQGFAHFFELKGLDDGRDHFHKLLTPKITIAAGALYISA
jgi:hypothetical protein